MFSIVRANVPRISFETQNWKFYNETLHTYEPDRVMAATDGRRPFGKKPATPMGARVFRLMRLKPYSNYILSIMT
ncbi:hypothetical protein QCN28_05325 [Bordetella bronchiseptica]|uniref:hypothetical protein n=1 Tax=Bordetella bronchiseptica TaxID=518 RepID=UPI003F745D5D